MTNWCNGCRNSGIEPALAANACGRPSPDASRRGRALHGLRPGSRCPGVLRGSFHCWVESRGSAPAAKEIDIAGGSACPMSWLEIDAVGGVRRRSGRGECLRDGGQVMDVGVGGVEAEPHGGDRCVGASCLAPGASISEMRSPIPPRGSAT